MCKHAVKKLPFVIRYVPDQYKTQKMCNKAILENGRTLESVPDRYKTQEMCDKAVDNYADAFALIAIRLKICVIKPSILILLQSFSNSFVPECHKTQEMCDKAVSTCIFVFDSVPD